jgi:hypothetical protein
MEWSQQLETLLAVVEPADKAAADASALEAAMLEPPYNFEYRVRGRLLSIEHEQGLSQMEMQPIWNFLGLEYGPPAPPGA